MSYNLRVAREFCAYGLIEPWRSSVFYIGQTAWLRQRIMCHNAGDAACSAWPMIRKLRQAKEHFAFCVFGVFDNRMDAQRLERMLVLSLPDLLNKRGHSALLSQKLFPITEYDDELLWQATNPMPEVQDYMELVPAMVARRPGERERKKAEKSK